MASDTSLVFNLIARDRASATIQQFQERITTASAGIAAGVGAALGAGIAANLDATAANAKLAAQLGIGQAEAADLAKVSASVYAHAWGESTAEVNDAIRGVYQQIGDVSQAKGGLEGVTTKVMALAETFDQDLGGVTKAVGQMLKTGLAKNADEALDILTRGFQTGADKAEDLLDTMNEYGVQFHKFGLDGQTATGLLSQGLKAGARDADLVADAIKEFSIRAIDGSKGAADAYKALHLDADKMMAQIGKGGTSARDALGLVLDKLRGIKDPVAQSAAAVGLFGTQAEDLGQALYALDPKTAVAALGQVSGAAETMADTVGSSPAAALETFKRQAMAKLSEVGGVMVKFAMDHQAVFEPLAYTLMGLAATVLVVKAAMITYSAVSAIVAGANAIISASAWGVIGNWMRMMGIGLMVYLRIAAAALVSALSTAAAWTGSALLAIGTWIAAVVTAGATAAAQFLMMAGRAVIWAATMAAQWLIAMGPIGWIIAAVAGLVALIIYYWDEIKAFTIGAWNSIWGYVQDVTSRKISEFIARVSGLPGQIRSIFAGAGEWLYGAGRDVVMGIWRGIQGMGGWLRGVLIGWAKSMIPGPIMKALGIASPSRLLADQVGQWIPAGVVLGIEARQGDVDAAMAGLVQPPSSGIASAAGQQLAGGASGAPLTRPGFGPQGLTVRLVVDAAVESAFTTALRKSVRVVGQGSVQTMYGQAQGT
ncbi:phage tail tape measure protein [Streptomyces sp. NPDC059385]|uniref:phage tail tape measure protein n=1 Tax=Streptomyces sp. NPDC059385 TaxID=3346817 RepID=UPI0036A98623